MGQQRDSSIDLLKFLAVFIIINSHCDILYPESIRALATGGAIGDCLFLFVSGFTLALSPVIGFGDWYKRRVVRIFPSVFVCALAASAIDMEGRISVLRLFGGEFIIAIMIYYVMLWCVRRFLADRIAAVITAIGIMSAVVYVWWFPYKYETGETGMYGTSTLYRWLPYSAFMMFGMYVGGIRGRLDFCGWRDGAMLMLSVALFYGIQLAGRMNHDLAPWQVLSLVPLAGVVFYMYKVCNIRALGRICSSRAGNLLICGVAGLCLESYLIQLPLITDRFNGCLIFPLNLIFMTFVIILAAYLCRCGSRLFSQTFAPSSYDWKAIFKL